MSSFLKETAEAEREIRRTLCLKCNSNYLLPALTDKGLIGLCPIDDFPLIVEYLEINDQEDHRMNIPDKLPMIIKTHFM